VCFNTTKKKEFLVFLYSYCIEIYKYYKYKWDAFEYESEDILDAVPCEIYYISSISAQNKELAIKEAKKFFNKVVK